MWPLGEEVLGFQKHSGKTCREPSMGRPRTLEWDWEKGPGLYRDTGKWGTEPEEMRRPGFVATRTGMPSHSTVDRLNSTVLNCVGPFTHGYFQ